MYMDLSSSPWEGGRYMRDGCCARCATAQKLKRKALCSIDAIGDVKHKHVAHSRKVCLQHTEDLRRPTVCFDCFLKVNSFLVPVCKTIHEGLLCACGPRDRPLSAPSTNLRETLFAHIYSQQRVSESLYLQVRPEHHGPRDQRTRPADGCRYAALSLCTELFSKLLLQALPYIYTSAGASTINIVHILMRHWHIHTLCRFFWSACTAMQMNADKCQR